MFLTNKEQILSKLWEEIMQRVKREYTNASPLRHRMSGG